jgi:sugar phosphate isomerase/epimerase
MSEAVISTWVLGKELSEALDIIRQCGFQLVEVLANGSPQGRDLREEQAVEEIWELVSGRGMQVWSVHNEFGPGWDLAAPVESERREAVSNAAALLRGAGALGAHYVVLHAGEYVVEEPVERQLERFLVSAQRLVPVAAEAGVRLALENLPPEHLGHSPEQIEWLLERLAEEVVGFCCDTGHAVLAGGQPAAYVNQFGPRLIAAHLQDTDGQEDGHLFPGRGRVDWEGFFAALREIGFDRPLTLEAAPPAGMSCDSMAEIVRRALGELEPVRLPPGLGED